MRGHPTTYPGAKTNSGILQFLINNIPAHSTYIEACAGSAQLYLAKLPAARNYLCDVDPITLADLRPLQSASTILQEQSVVATLEKYGYDAGTFIYIDPPYPKDARRAGRAYYRHEMLADESHLQVLTAAQNLRAACMISTRCNRLYSQALKGWRCCSFSTVGHRGPVEELIYMNYPPPALLHQYDQLGTGFTDRQRIKRKVGRFASKIAALPQYERHLFIQQLLKNDYSAVAHFTALQSHRG